MKRWNGLTVVAVALLAYGFPGLARAAVITTLYNTGVDASHTALSDGSLNDPHYTLTSVPGGTTTTLIRTDAGGYPFPPYFVGTSASTWIGPNNAIDFNSPPGDYHYQTTFDLSAYVLGTASISGQWSTDNSGLQILLNGSDIGAPATAANQFAVGFVPFSLSSGLLPGVNTLEFIVHNDQLSTALRVELTGTADLINPPSTVPEPASLTLFSAFGALGIFGYGWRRRKQTV